MIYLNFKKKLRQILSKAKMTDNQTLFSPCFRGFFNFAAFHYYLPAQTNKNIPLKAFKKLTEENFLSLPCFLRA
jgi:hypothetical protein